MNKEKYDHILSLCNNLGSFPSYLKIKNYLNNPNNFKYNYYQLKNTHKEIIIIFESKFENSLYSKDDNVKRDLKFNHSKIPEFVYHLTSMDYLDNILKIGLIPKSKNRRGSHPGRIYVFKDINNYLSLLIELKKNDKWWKITQNSNIKNIKSNKYCLLEIKTDKNMIFHTDPNHKGSIFTYN